MSDSPLAQITPFVLTHDEEPNIARCLECLRWARRVLVVDSGSTDRTLALIAAFPNAQMVHRAFDSHSRQANFALSLIDSPWVLSLDADYILPPDFVLALGAGEWNAASVYFAPFRQCVRGQPLRASLYPPRAVVYARAGARYEQDGHTQRFVVGDRRIELLPEFILHDDRKSRTRWLRNQRNYARLEAEKLGKTSREKLDVADRIRATGWLAPLVILPYVLFNCGSARDGRLGFLYAFERAHVEALLSYALWTSRLRNLQRFLRQRTPAVFLKLLNLCRATA